MSLSIIQERAISQLHPSFEKKVRRFILMVQDRLGYEVILTSLFRSLSKQEQLDKTNPYATGAGFSYHNFGFAFDCNCKKGKQVLTSKSSKEAWINSGIVAIAKELGMRWGGDFKSLDLVHFDDGGTYSITYLREQTIKQFGSIAALDVKKLVA